MTARFGRLVLLSLLAGCAMPPRDPFWSASNALRHDDLVAALMAYDAVPVTHARYPEARAAAIGVEQRMRRCQELVLQALMLRGEWRDDEALAVLQRARGLWPSLPGVENLMAATRLRLDLLDREQRRPDVVVPPPAVPLIEFAPRHQSPPRLDEFVAPSVSANEARIDEPIPEVAGPDGASAPGVVLQVVDAPPPVSASSPAILDGQDPVALALVVAEGRLSRGELDRAIADLIELARRYPDELRVRLRLSRLLHQRALRHYGEGALEAAISDWQRVVQMDPENELARQSLRAVHDESRRRSQ